MAHTGFRLSVILLSAAAPAALAQGTMSFSWSATDTGNGDGIVEPGERAVLTLWAFMDPDQSGNQGGYAGSIFDIAGDPEEWQRGTVHRYENLVDSVNTGPGDLNADNSIRGIESFQLPVFFNPHFDPSNPIAIYRIEWTPAHYRWRQVQVWSGNHQNASVYVDTFGTSVEYDPVDWVFTMQVVPAPGGLALLGVGLVASRRRR